MKQKIGVKIFQTGLILLIPMILVEIFRPSWLPGIVFIVFPIVVICCLVFGVLIGNKKAAIKRGKWAIGEFVSLRQTGKMSDNQPVCELTFRFMTKDGQEITTAINKTVQQSDLSKYKPGYGMMVTYDPQMPQHIEIDAGFPDPLLRAKSPTDPPRPKVKIVTRIGTIMMIIGFILLFLNIILRLPDNSPQLFVLLGAMFVFLFGGILLVIIGRKNPGVKNGILVGAELVSLRQTSTVVNYQYVCVLTVKYATLDGQQLTSFFRMVVQQTDLAKLKPGYKMPIEYDPQKPQNIKFVPYAASSTLQAAKDQYDLTHGEITQEFIDIRDKGTKAKGVILASKPTGNIMDNKSEMELQVKVTRPDGSTYEVNTTKDVPQTGLSFAAPGSIVHVFYMPDNEQNIMIGFYT